jgi:hypothetical protein
MRRTKQNTIKRNTRSRNRSSKSQRPLLQNVPKSLSRFAPVTTANHQDVWLTYQATGVLNNAAGTAASKYWDVNCAYDVDPALGSTSTAGFDSWTTQFRYYRVLCFQATLEVASLDDRPLSVVTGTFNLTPPGSTVGYDSYVGNPMFRRHLISPLPSGAPRTVLRTPVLQIKSVDGDKSVLTDPNYGSVTNTVPANKVFWGFSIAPPGGTLTNGVVYAISIRMGTRFTQRVVLDQ